MLLATFIFVGVQLYALPLSLTMPYLGTLARRCFRYMLLPPTWPVTPNPYAVLCWRGPSCKCHVFSKCGLEFQLTIIRYSML